MALATVGDNKNADVLSYLRLARADHWFKNVFMLPGTALAIIFAELPINEIFLPTLIALIALCLAASANYVLNEWLDAGTDKYHPVKKDRPAVTTNLNPIIVYGEYFLFASSSLIIAGTVNRVLLASIAALLVMGLLYNVPPFRSKDRVYLDVLSESVNNPIRMVIGWSALVASAMPPSSILLSYWMGGAFLMATKRFAEFRMIGDQELAASYRRSFRHYTEDSLMVSAFFYALCSAFFLGVFLIKYRIEFLLAFPLFALLFSWYLAISLRKSSVVQTPEKLYTERRFVAFVVFLALFVTALFFIDVPVLNLLVDPVHF
jgi:4-hydroxybenzoate polyprenyltransferase